MFVIFGTRNYGKVDHVPGLFYVATSFFHINFIPLIPVTTYIVVDGSDRCVRIPMCFKSVLTAWARLGLILGVILALVFGCFSFMEGLAAQDLGAIASALGLFFTSALCGVFFWLTYLFSKATNHRAIQLAERLELSNLYLPQLRQALVAKQLDPDGRRRERDDMPEAQPVRRRAIEIDDRDREIDEYDRRARERNRDEHDPYDYDRRNY
jgi:hypothetical protein